MCEFNYDDAEAAEPLGSGRSEDQSLKAKEK